MKGNSLNEFSRTWDMEKRRNNKIKADQEKISKLKTKKFKKYKWGISDMFENIK
jgi:hypothetical protein